MTDLDQHLSGEERRVRRTHLLVCAGVLVVCAVAYVGVAAFAAGDLPDRLAVHFGVSGAADGWMGRDVALVSFGLVAVGLPTLLLVVFALGEWWRGASARAISALVCGLSGGLVALFVHLLRVQTGLVDTEGLRIAPWTMLWPLAIAVGVGLLVAAVLPPALPQPEPESVDPLVLVPGDRASWFGQVRTSQLILWVLLGGVVTVVLAVLASGQWILWPLALLMVLLVPAMSSFRVTIDRDGLRWRSALGVPRGHVPLAEVSAVSVVDVRPGDYGGYGIRSVPGATAIVTRHGQALQVSRGEGRRFVITVEDAAVAASVLEGLRLRG